MEVILALEEEISKIHDLDIEPQTKLMGEEIEIVEQNVDIELVVSM